MTAKSFTETLIAKYTRPAMGKLKRFVPSEQQAAFIHWVVTGTGSTILEAVAGAGKSTTLAEALRYMQGGAYVCAFNRKIADEFKAKLAFMGIDWKAANANTFHGFGYGFFRKVYPDVKIDGAKVATLFAAYAQEQQLDETYARALKDFVLDLVSLAKQEAIGVLCPVEDTAKWMGIADHHDMFEDLPEFINQRQAVDVAIELFKRSHRQCPTVIDFDDMIYAPLAYKVRIWANAWVLVDEAQDTNAARRALAKRMLKPGGRLVAVGDRGQAIYGFTGADADSLDIIAAEFNACRLPLTVTYRCPQAVVRFAQQWVPHIQAHNSNGEGIVGKADAAQITAKGNPLALGADDVIICRNTKPLVAMAYGFIRAGVACYVEGREIGTGLIKMATRWKVKTLAQLRAKLEQHLERELAKFTAKGQETKAQAVEDKVETLLTMIESVQRDGGQTVADLVASINKLFGDTKEGERPACLTLCTGHKSKGREWKRVFWLNRATTLPSKYARKDWQLQQEDNLCYVIATRAMEELYEFDYEPKEREKKAV